MTARERSDDPLAAECPLRRETCGLGSASLAALGAGRLLGGKPCTGTGRGGAPLVMRAAVRAECATTGRGGSASPGRLLNREPWSGSDVEEAGSAPAGRRRPARDHGPEAALAGGEACRATSGSASVRKTSASAASRGRRAVGRARREERGSGTVLALGIIGVLVAVAVAVSGLIQAQAAAGRARSAADLSALAGATALSSVLAPADPCVTAGRVAQANGAVLESCVVDGEDVVVTVTVHTTVLGVPRLAQSAARAGPVNPL